MKLSPTDSRIRQSGATTQPLSPGAVSRRDADAVVGIDATGADKDVLSDEQLAEFEENGFLVLEHVLDDADLEPLEREYEALLDTTCRNLFRQGRIESIFEAYDFTERFARTVAACPDCIDEFNISLPLINGAIEPETYRAHFGPAVFRLQRNDKILDVVESVIGSEIASSPVQQMRIKPPQSSIGDKNQAHSNVGITTWHQDTVAVLPEADATEQLTVWVAVTGADLENGCLVSIPGSHREGSHPHEPGKIAREPTVPDSIIDGRTGVALPVGRGGIIIFHKQNIHSSLPNRSDRLRWSVDLRYHPIGQPSGRPAFPGFVARSRRDPASELHDVKLWQQGWEVARRRILNGEYEGPIFRDWKSTD
ncbi:MAG: phytanoyl-CoA dioxygenase family protein [Gammaproteobacteria bacterium]|nr:phytanoyl-CoA dioxygenase family protein [Gammaproteobacteria bacterium]